MAGGSKLGAHRSHTCTMPLNVGERIRSNSALSARNGTERQFNRLAMRSAQQIEDRVNVRPSTHLDIDQLPTVSPSAALPVN